MVFHLDRRRERFIDVVDPRYTGGVELHLPPELQTKLTRLAAHRGSDPETLAREAVERLVEYDEWIAGEVEKGLASIERGATLSHEEVGVRLETLLEKRSRG